MKACALRITFATAFVTMAVCACGSSPDETEPSSGGSAAAGAAGSGGQGVEGGEGGTGLSGGGAGGGLWRPFSDDSPWNSLIPDNPELEADSAALIEDLKTSSPYGPFISVNIEGYSIPLYEADAASPQIEMQCAIGGMGFSGDNGNNATALLPMPANAAPDPQSDHHLLIVDREANLEWGMWNTVNTAGAWTCGVGANIDLTGTGVRPLFAGNPTWYTSVGARACGYPLIAGLIRVPEVKAGAIEHALVIAYPHIRAGLYTSPASTPQGRVGDDAIMTRGIACGGRIQLDPTLDLDSLGLSPAYRAILRALQRYGAYVGDYSGAISLYAENSPEAQAYWASGVLGSYDLDGVLDISHFRALKQGTLYDFGNGN